VAFSLMALELNKPYHYQNDAVVYSFAQKRLSEAGHKIYFIRSSWFLASLSSCISLQPCGSTPMIRHYIA
jgi:phosphoserine aminotransferase